MPQVTEALSGVPMGAETLIRVPLGAEALRYLTGGSCYLSIEIALPWGETPLR